MKYLSTKTILGTLFYILSQRRQYNQTEFIRDMMQQVPCTKPNGVTSYHIFYDDYDGDYDEE